MPIRVNSSARTQPVEGRFLIEPGICASCGKTPSSPNELFADTHIELEFFGAIYFCEACCSEFGAFAMMVPHETHEKALLREEAKQNEIIRLRKQITYLKGVLDDRINRAGNSEPDSDGSASLSLFETESESSSFDSLINSLKSESVESSTDE